MSETAARPNEAMPDHAARARSIAFLNWAHAVDHYVLLIFPTVVLQLEAVYHRPYSELIALSTACFVAFGVFSLPAGWLADHWSRRNMMMLFFGGCGLSLVAAALSPTPIVLAGSLLVLGIFSAIYHPVGMAMLIDASQARGRTLAFNGVCGNLGAALAAGITAAITTAFGWHAAFLIPAMLCLATVPLYWRAMPDDRHTGAKRVTAAGARLAPMLAIIMFSLFMIIALAAGLTFNAVTVALPKVVEERLGENVSLAAVGSLATVVFMCGALAQLAVGRLVERIAPQNLLVFISAMGLAGILWASQASGLWLMAALAVVMMSIYGQVTVNDMVIARYSADAWRGRVYAVRYFLLFITSGAAIAMIAGLHENGGFDLVFVAVAAVMAVFLVATIGVAVIANGASRQAVAAQPAE